MLGKLEARLRGYSAWLPDDWRLFVVVDRDDDDCFELKARLEEDASRASIVTRRSSGGQLPWQLVTRIVIEELEAWYFGDWAAVVEVYPRVSSTIPRRQAFRKPDAILGGTWEAFLRVMQQHGYFKTGLPKIDVARAIGSKMVPDRNCSESFRSFYRALIEASF